MSDIISNIDIMSQYLYFYFLHFSDGGYMFELYRGFYAKFGN